MSFGYIRDDGHTHQGVDLPARVGTPVWSVGDGVVELVAEPGTPGVRGYGRVIVVRQSDGLRAMYAHLSRSMVREGDLVVLGQQLAEVGDTCDTRSNTDARCKDGAHLHFELARGPYSATRLPVRIDPLGDHMPDPDEFPAHTGEHTPATSTSWHTLNQLYGELYETLPMEAQNRPEIIAKRELWAQAFEESSSLFGLSKGALEWWVDEYNADRLQLLRLGIPESDLPPKARHRATWDEDESDHLDELIPKATKAVGALGGVAVIIALAVIMWGRSK